MSQKIVQQNLCIRRNFSSFIFRRKSEQIWVAKGADIIPSEIIFPLKLLKNSLDNQTVELTDLKNI